MNTNNKSINFAEQVFALQKAQIEAMAAKDWPLVIKLANECLALAGAQLAAKLH